MRFRRPRRRRAPEARGAPPPTLPVAEEVPAGPAVVEEELGPPAPPPPPPRPIIWPWLLLLLLLVLGGLVALYVFTRDDDNKPRQTATTQTNGQVVPNVVGRRQGRAVQVLNRAGFTPRVRTGSSKLPDGVVFAQQPAAQARLARGSEVTISVSTGPPGVGVPNVVGLRAQAAIARLRSARLGSRLTNVFAPKPAGVVLSQKPVAGKRSPPGTVVTLRVSKGPRPVTVPDLTGQPQSSAESRLRALGLKPFVFHVPSDDPDGTVVAQVPVAGATAPRGSKVRINVSTGRPQPPTGGTTGGQSQTSTVPNVVGLKQTAALRRLQSSGFVVNVTYVRSSKPSGTVISQSPAGGATASRGSRVSLRVSSGQNPRPVRAVPDVVGEDEAAATSELRAAGFTVEVLPSNTSDQTQDGIVLDQQPSGGSSAPTGSTVTIYVGQFSG